MTVRSRTMTVRSRTMTVRSTTMTVRSRTMTVRSRTMTVRSRTMTARSRQMTVRSTTMTVRSTTMTVWSRTMTVRSRTMTVWSRTMTVRSTTMTVRSTTMTVWSRTAELPATCEVAPLTSQQHANVCEGRICSDKFTSCHTEIEVADQTFYLTQSQYTDTGPISPSADPITPGAWQGSHWSASFEVSGMTRPRKNPGASGIRTRDLPLSRRTP